MIRKIFILLCISLLGGTLYAKAVPNTHTHESLDQVIKAAVTDLIKDNAAFAESRSEEHFHGLDIQNPRVTMVMCSDSRVQVDNFSHGAQNDIFVARNIGNQYTTTQGSVEYGVNVLNTPVLIFVGHSQCGAIKAARGDVKQLAPAIRRELLTMDVKAARDEKQAVALNVNNQVEKALSDFKERVDSKKVAIIGAIYDFLDDYGYGKGQLIIINLNGDKDPQQIKGSHYFDGIEKVKIGIPPIAEGAVHQTK